MTTLSQDLFAQARELPAAEREAFLQQACGGNAELHLEVLRLLVDAERAASFFGDADGATLGAEEFKETYAEKEGDTVGSYKLRQAIGEGGFGVVWMAEQSVPISRMVALKVIKAGMDTKQDIARFLENEPVTAAAPSVVYRFRKFARRNKAALAVAALVSAVLVAATGINLWRPNLARKAAAEAIAMQEDALASMRKVLPPKHPYLLGAMQVVSGLDWQDGRRDEAQKLKAELEALALPE